TFRRDGFPLSLSCRGLCPIARQPRPELEQRHAFSGGARPSPRACWVTAVGASATPKGRPRLLADGPVQSTRKRSLRRRRARFLSLLRQVFAGRLVDLLHRQADLAAVVEAQELHLH